MQAAERAVQRSAKGVDAEPLGDDALEVDPPPAHDPVFLAVKASFHNLSELGQLVLRKARLGTLGPVVD